MYFTFFFSAALLSLCNAHAVILAAQGELGSPASIGFQVDPAIARNCTTISPCQQDTTIIRDSEIASNVVNECGRTELTGNIDVGENTENQLAAGTVTSVKKGSTLTVAIHQVNADGAGPYTCDLDQTSNAGIISHNLTVEHNIPGVNGLSQAKTQDFNITVMLPNDLACIGGSTGNICTVRCRNNAQAGPFGGCFAVQQTDIKLNVNSANQITTGISLDEVNKQVAQDQLDFPAAVAANQQAGTGEAVQGLAAVNALLKISVTTKTSPTQTLSLSNVGTAAASAVVTTTTSTTRKGHNGNDGNSRPKNNRNIRMRWARRLLLDDTN
ncbi:hypothetical protein B7463_g8556, partial [Scytalidium lignicola]